jgi:hypothetical protein
MKSKCQGSFDQCSGLKSAEATSNQDEFFAGAFSTYANNSEDATDRGNDVIVV